MRAACGTGTLDALTLFERHRARLRGLAYRMLGSVCEADDLLQETFLRWYQADLSTIRSPEAWLVTAVTRLSLDRLRRLAAERAAYCGPWLPEPWFEGIDADPGRRLERVDDLSVAFLLLLERLSPEERATFLLREIFDVGYPAIAATLGKSEVACRQMAHRARVRLRSGRRRFVATDEAQRRILRQFQAAAEAGDEAGLLALLAPDATYLADGGGRVAAARRAVIGSSRIARLVAGVWRKRLGAMAHCVAAVNGGLGLLSWADMRPFAALAIDIDGSRVRALYWVLNPEKLRGFPTLNATLTDNRV